MLIAIMMLAYSLPLCLAVGFYFGRKTRDTAENKQPLSVKFARNKNAPKKESDEQRRQRVLAENIENFGTDVPQQEV